MTKIKNILLVGSSGAGKSALANTLINRNGNFEEVFKESAGSVSETRQSQTETFQSGDITYRVIDTIGIGDTQLSETEVAYRISKVAGELKEGIEQVFFITGGRFTEKEVGVFGLLSGALFGPEMLEFTTIIRTNFPEFESRNARERDYRELTDGDEIGSKLVSKIGRKRVIYTDNPPLKGNFQKIAANKETRSLVNAILIDHLKSNEIADRMRFFRSETLPYQTLNRKIDELGANKDDKEQVKSVVWEIFDNSIRNVKGSTEFGGEIGQKYIPVFGPTIGAGIGFAASFVGTWVAVPVRLTEASITGGINTVKELAGSGSKEASLEQQLNILGAENTYLKREIEFADRELTTEKRERVKLEENLKTEKEVSANLKTRVTQLENENQTLKTEINNLNKVIDGTEQITQIVQPTK